MPNTTGASSSIRDFREGIANLINYLSGDQYSGDTDLQKLIKEFQKSVEDANIANETRYEDLVGDTLNNTLLNNPKKDTVGAYGQLWKDVEKQYGNFGAQRSADIRSNYRALQSSGYQDLISRGLRGSTIAPSMAAGYQRQSTNDVNRLMQDIQREKSGYLNNIGLARLGVAERRYDQPPDLSAYINAMNAMGRAGGG